MELTRTAGQFLEEQIEILNQNIVQNAIPLLILASFIVGFSGATILFGIEYIKSNIFILHFGNLFLLIILITVSKKLGKEIKKIDNRILNNKKGIAGEKNVAYELAMLQSENTNFYVINDFQHPKVGNIDHIIIYSKGVFAIETKNFAEIHRKCKAKAIKQAKNSAVTLQKELQDNFSIKWVTPVLIFVGKHTSNSDKIVKITTPKNISSIINHSQNTLNNEKIKEVFLFLNKIQQI